VTVRCARCHRPLRKPVEIAGSQYGSTCARSVTGAKPARVRILDQTAVKRDDRTPDLFGWVQP
jgi:hypothetical protein